MNKEKVKNQKKDRRAKRVRAKISGTKALPRLNVYRSNTGIYVQLIDDENAKTLVSAHTREISKKGTKTVVSFELGKLVAKKAIESKIEKIVFDRGGQQYHGRIKAVADGARKAGLKF